MKKRIKVLQLQQKYYIRSSDLHEEVIKAFPVEFFEVTSAYLRKHPEPGEMISISEHIKYFNLSTASMKGLRLYALWKLWLYCRQENFDIIITNGFKTLNMLLKLNKFLKTSHCIGIIHCIGDFDRLYRRAEANLFIDNKWSFVAVSNAVKKYLCNLNSGFSETNVHTINNAIDIPKTKSRLLNRNEACRQLNINPDKFTFGTIGRLVSVKGHKYLLESFKRIHLQFPETQLVIIGGGRLYSEMQSYINNNNLSKHVILTGELFDAFQYMKAFNTFILSSLSEGLPLVLLESMVAHVPVIATNVGGVSSVLPDSDFLVPPKDTVQLETHMKKILQLSESERQNIANNLYQHVSTYFTIENYRKQYLKLAISKLDQNKLQGLNIE